MGAVVTRVVKFIRKGAAGDPAPYVELSRTSILYNANSSGYSTASQNFVVNCYLKVNGNTCSIADVGSIVVTTISGVTVTKNSTSQLTINVTHSQQISGVVTVRITGSYNGQSYTAQASITVEANREGGQGPRGYRGPALRGPQDWAQMDIDYQFYKGDESNQEPYEDFVVYNGNYYKCIKTHTKTASNYPGSSTDTSSHLWQLSDKLAIIAANVLFAKHGYFGSAIISGDWMISTNGTIDGNAYNNGATYQGVIAYSLFNPNNPLGVSLQKYAYASAYSFTSSNNTKAWTTLTLESGKVYYLKATGRGGSSSSYYVRVRNTSTGATHTPVLINSTTNITRSGYFNCLATGSYYIEIYNPSGISGTVESVELIEKNFAPVYALDLLTGAVYQGNAYIRGTINANLFYSKTRLVTESDYQINPETEPYSSFVYNEVSGFKFIRLPKASDYDGMEITIFIKSTQNYSLMDNGYRVAPKSNSGDSIYIKQNIGQFKDTGNTSRSAQILSYEYYWPGGSVLLIANERYVFKSMLGAWYAIQGVFTGE